jgi:EAL and modified HD-GYP domain-containing signal transduction protein
VALADIVKVDVLATAGDERAAVARRLRSAGVRLLAEKVETHEEAAAVRALGFSLYQGYYFCRPEMLVQREPRVAQLSYLRLLTELNDVETDIDRLEPIVKSDVALSLKLLRYLNSAGFGLRHQVSSIGHALRLLGERPFKRWATVMALHILGSDKAHELMVQTVVRARFAELVAHAAGLGRRADEAFIVGLFSTLDAMLDRPIGDVMRDLPLASDLQAALLTHQGVLGALLALVLAWESGDWEAVMANTAQLGLGERDVGADYREAVAWASRFMEPTGQPVAVNGT